MHKMPSTKGGRPDETDGARDGGCARGPGGLRVQQRAHTRNHRGEHRGTDYGDGGADDHRTYDQYDRRCDHHKIRETATQELVALIAQDAGDLRNYAVSFRAYAHHPLAWCSIADELGAHLRARRVRARPPPRRCHCDGPGARVDGCPREGHTRCHRAVAAAGGRRPPRRWRAPLPKTTRRARTASSPS